MLHVLTDDEAFAIMNSDFDKLEPNMVIDLANKTDRFPAIVLNVYRELRAFDVLPLTRENVGELVRMRRDAKWLMSKTVEVTLARTPEEPRSMWNKIPQS